MLLWLLLCFIILICSFVITPHLSPSPTFAPTTNTSRPIKRFYWRNFNQKTKFTNNFILKKKKKKKKK
jgi:hypothetical protein